VGRRWLMVVENRGGGAAPTGMGVWLRCEGDR
jgi:hypothetical protein